MKFNFISFFSHLFIKNKKLYFLIHELNCLLKNNSILAFPNFIKKVLLKSSFLLIKIKISFLWIFSEKKFINFLSIFNASNKFIISFQILKFSLKKEIFFLKIKKKNKFKHPLLILNNFPTNNIKDFILTKTFKEIFDGKEKITINKSKIIIILLIEYNIIKKKIEFRVYQIIGSISFLYPRNLRKKLFLHHELKKKKKKNKVTDPQKKLYLNSNLSKIFLKNYSESHSSIKTLEIGPRISFKVLEIVKR
jgi:hypothetical protein